MTGVNLAAKAGKLDSGSVHLSWKLGFKILRNSQLQNMQTHLWKRSGLQGAPSNNQDLQFTQLYFHLTGEEVFWFCRIVKEDALTE